MIATEAIAAVTAAAGRLLPPLIHLSYFGRDPLVTSKIARVVAVRLKRLMFASHQPHRHPLSQSNSTKLSLQVSITLHLHLVLHFANFITKARHFHWRCY